MLLAPFTLAEAPTRRTVNRDLDSHPVPPWLMVWAIGGLVSMLLFPSLRGGTSTGMSGPFWLVAAPLINILWLTRRRWSMFLRSRLAMGPASRPLRNCRSR
jgi:hypothetical protein